ncbi:hypothetical protein D3H65_28055 [Paraflavitalea soli]|uniref:Uncharacterized protein n=1 Tax=Paraflavitalea soli TaxID=2315862 RepID=A0A3B7N6C1_9BACT|nr:clostripain-related cysteine peptidase [Paraflavitalea soli]AXY77601.1 hypothetical protein D3H65_28055 [Paraflavitalea soli]
MDKKWVIVFLIYADFRTKESFSMSEEMRVEINDMLRSVIKVPINPDRARLFVIFNGIKYFFPATGKAPRTETRFIMYEMVKCQHKRGNCFGRCEVNRADVTTLQDSNKLSHILSYIEVMDDEEVFFVTWDHGNAFGIFREEPHPLPQIRKPINDSQELQRFPYLRLFWERAMEVEDMEAHQFKSEPGYAFFTVQAGHDLFAVSAKKEIAESVIPLLTSDKSRNFFRIEKGRKKLVFDTSAAEPTLSEIGFQESEVTELLHNHELADAFRDWLGDRKVGVLLMMNCWMMNLHTMYAMKDRVQCLVAPQGDIANPGYNYREILSFIYYSETPVTARGLAEECIRTSENAFAKRRARILNPQNPKTIDSWKIIAVDLQTIDVQGKKVFDQQLQSLQQLVTAIIEAVSQNPTPELKYMLKYVRSVCFDFTNNRTIMVDFLNWCMSVKSADHFFLPDHSQVFGSLDSMIIELRNYILGVNGKQSLQIKATKGIAVYSFPDPLLPVAVINLPPTGYSLFFPQYAFADKPNLIDNVRSDRLLNGPLESWKEFLKKVIDKEITF